MHALYAIFVALNIETLAEVSYRALWKKDVCEILI